MKAFSTAFLCALLGVLGPKSAFSADPQAPAAASQPTADDELKEYCKTHAAQCEKAGVWFKTVKALAADLNACYAKTEFVPPRCAEEEIDTLFLRYRAVDVEAKELELTGATDYRDAGVKISRINEREMEAGLELVAQQTTRLESKIDGLAQGKPSPEQIEALWKEGAVVQGRWQRLSQSVTRCVVINGYTLELMAASETTKSVNELGKKLARARDRLDLAHARARGWDDTIKAGLVDPFNRAAQAGAVVSGPGSAAAPADAASGSGGRRMAPAKGNNMALNVHLPERQEPPPPGDSKYRARDHDKRAALVHQQCGNTCAVNAQEQLLKYYGYIENSGAETEATLRDEAARNGYYNNGTPSYFTDALLQKHNMITTKHVGASVDELDKVALGGKLLIVTVDPGKLWNNPKHINGSHAVVLIDVETDKDNKVTGYYINDSGKFGSGTYYPRAAFVGAWNKKFVEPE